MVRKEAKAMLINFFRNVLAVLLVAMITACSGVSKGQILLRDADRELSENRDQAEIKYRQIIESKLCTDQEADVPGYYVSCLSRAKVNLALAYQLDKEYEKMIPLLDSVLAAGTSKEANDYCKSIYYKSWAVEGLGKIEEAYNLIETVGKRKDCQKLYSVAAEIGKLRLANILKDSSKVSKFDKAIYYKDPNSNIAPEYIKALKILKNKDELKDVEKYQKLIQTKIDKWEKINTPPVSTGGWSVEQSEEQAAYYSKRGEMFRNALEAVESLKLEGYEEYLIAKIKDSDANKSYWRKSIGEWKQIESNKKSREQSDKNMGNMFLEGLDTLNRLKGR